MGEIKKTASEIADLFLPVFKRRNWTWGLDEGAHVPDHYEIETTINELVGACQTHYKTGTGRIEVWKPSNATFIVRLEGTRLKFLLKRGLKP